MIRIQFENALRIGAFSPAILMALILLLPCFVHGQGGYSMTMTYPTKPDLQVTEMKYWASNCTMYFRIANNGAASGKFNVWVDYYPVSKEIVSIPYMYANTSSWVEKSMWKTNSYGQKYCGMTNVTKVRSVANARYLTKYSNYKYTVGDLISTGTYAPYGWTVVERSVNEQSVTNNELVLPKSSLPMTTTKISLSF